MRNSLVWRLFPLFLLLLMVVTGQAIELVVYDTALVVSKLPLALLLVLAFVQAWRDGRPAGSPRGGQPPQGGSTGQGAPVAAVHS
jgi:hypothetical protein